VQECEREAAGYPGDTVFGGWGSRIARAVGRCLRARKARVCRNATSGGGQLLSLKGAFSESSITALFACCSCAVFLLLAGTASAATYRIACLALCSERLLLSDHCRVLQLHLVFRWQKYVCFMGVCQSFACT
jgi:hypothetical protein